MTDKWWDKLTGFVGDAWDWINDQVDTYLWDTDADIAVAESVIKDTVVTPFKDALDYLQDAWNWVNDQVDTHVWDTDADVATLEGLIKDALNIKSQDTDDLVRRIREYVDDIMAYTSDEVKDLIAWAKENINESVDKAGDKAQGGGGSATKTIVDTLPLPDSIKQIINIATGDFDFGVFGGILGGLIDNIAARINGWFENALIIGGGKK